MSISLSERINYILDGENLDGVGDNPDVINRPIKELIAILEAGDDINITVQRTGFDVNESSWDSEVETGDLVYLEITTAKYTKTPINDVVRTVGIADVENNTITTSGIFEYSDLTLTPGRLLYFSSSVDGSWVEEGDSDASKYLIGVAIEETKILFNFGVGAGTSDGQILGNAETGAVMYLSQSTSEDLVIPDGSNALVVDSLTLEDGASLTIPDDSVMKVI